MHLFFLFPTLEGVQLFNPLRAFVGSTSSICITLVSINTSIEVAASTLGLTALSSSINTWIDCINTHLGLLGSPAISNDLHSTTSDYQHLRAAFLGYDDWHGILGTDYSFMH